MASRLLGAVALLTICAALWAVQSARAGVASVAHAHEATPTDGAHVSSRRDEPLRVGPLPAPLRRPARLSTARTPCVVRGLVRDAQGRPAADAQVRLSDSDENHTGSTREDGTFSLEASPGEYLLRAQLEGAVSPALHPLVLGPGEELDGLELQLGEGLTVSGVVLNASGEGVWMCASLPSLPGLCLEQASATDAGTFELGPLAAGPIHLEARAGSRTIAVDTVAGAQYVRLALEALIETAPSRPRKPRPERAERPVQLQLVDRNGAPLSLSSLTIEYRRASDHPSMAGRGGSETSVFTFAMPYETTEVCAMPSHYLPSCVPIDRARDAVTIRVERAAEVTGLLRGPDGTPVDDARVDCGVDHTWTGKTGRFALSCAPGPVTLTLTVGEQAALQVPIALEEEGMTYVELHL